MDVTKNWLIEHGIQRYEKEEFNCTIISWPASSIHNVNIKCYQYLRHPIGKTNINYIIFKLKIFSPKTGKIASSKYLNFVAPKLPLK